MATTHPETCEIWYHVVNIGKPKNNKPTIYGWFWHSLTIYGEFLGMVYVFGFTTLFRFAPGMVAMLTIVGIATMCHT